jgi:hypothetical protein
MELNVAIALLGRFATSAWSDTSFDMVCNDRLVVSFRLVDDADFGGRIRVCQSTTGIATVVLEKAAFGRDYCDSRGFYCVDKPWLSMRLCTSDSANH